MAETSALALPAYRRGQVVWIAPASERVFKFADDDDPKSSMHKPLIVRDFEVIPDGESNHFVYRLAVDAMNKEVFFVPESAIRTSGPSGC
jgi:hypothetical protein